DGVVLASAAAVDGGDVLVVEGHVCGRADGWPALAHAEYAGASRDGRAVYTAPLFPPQIGAWHRIRHPGVPPAAGVPWGCGGSVALALGDTVVADDRGACVARCVSAIVHAVSHRFCLRQRDRYVRGAGGAGAALAAEAPVGRAPGRQGEGTGAWASQRTVSGKGRARGGSASYHPPS